MMNTNQGDELRTAFYEVRFHIKWYRPRDLTAQAIQPFSLYASISFLTVPQSRGLSRPGQSKALKQRTAQDLYKKSVQFERSLFPAGPRISLLMQRSLLTHVGV